MFAEEGLGNVRMKLWAELGWHTNLWGTEKSNGQLQGIKQDH